MAARMFSEDQLEQLRSFPDIGKDDLIQVCKTPRKRYEKLEWFASVCPLEFGGARWRPRPGAAARPIPGRQCPEFRRITSA